MATRRRFWKFAAAQLVIAIGCVAVLFYFRTKAFLAGQPSGDLYANSWGFQLLVFFAVWLPATLLIVGTIIAVERALLMHHQIEKITESSP